MEIILDIQTSQFGQFKPHLQSKMEGHLILYSSHAGTITAAVNPQCMQCIISIKDGAELCLMDKRWASDDDCISCRLEAAMQADAAQCWVVLAEIQVIVPQNLQN